MRIDLHTHTIFSDGDLTPSELTRRAMDLRHTAIALTDHVDVTNIDFVVPALVKAAELSRDYITVVPGVELTYVPPSKIDMMAKKAKALGAQIVVVHGETVVEPVPPGTNLRSVMSKNVDVLAHPGLITLEEAEIAVKNGVALEITGRSGHNITNGHVANIARKAGAKMVVNSDAHTVGNLMDEARATVVAKGAGLTDEEIKLALNDTPYDLIKHLIKN
ncbi:phosphatase YcdX [Candidatus Methanoplasma termitum]|uniref:YcdX1 protein n=1 Tax=Candidatus Methanoplasma termitum TaxID=1577791 RepID=A0A0A7LAI2_9ARCH|nr:histidinol phosphate phosphatase domain-containing protein [Candidatus Methanoplasma termitum]AIZ56135.1 phosphatase YcdX [Candidatus Methanoplasma termitum]MCL2333476.1 histidinol phosphate phosphatase domain-containing protein [Candidatus Methanoplasma sp.]